MAVNAVLEALDKLDAYPSKEVLERFVTRLFQRLNAEYESLTDTAAPGAASQSISGHDHSLDFGGAPIPRSSILCVDTGDTAHIVKTETTRYQQTEYQIGPRYISPGLASSQSTYTDVMVYMVAVGGPVEIWAGAGEQHRVLVEPGDDLTPSWIPLRCPIRVDTESSFLYLTLRPTTNASTTWNIYKVNESESWALSVPEIGHRSITSTIGALGSVFEYFGTSATLDDDLVTALETLDSYTLKILLWSLNALYSHTLNEAPPGKSAYAIKGHDHYKIADGGQGGRPIPRGSIYYAGSSELAWMTAECDTQNKWEYADNQLSAIMRRSTGTPDPVTGTNASATPMWKAYVSAGLSSGTSVTPTGNPFLVAQVHIGSPTETGELRIYNDTANALSPAVAFTSTSHPEGWIEIPRIPCAGDAWNLFTLQVRTTASVSPSSPAYYAVRQVSLHEVYRDDTRNERASVTTSSGSGAAGVSRGGTQKKPME